MFLLRKKHKPLCKIPSSSLPEIKHLAEQLPSWTRQWAGNGDRIVQVKTVKGESWCYGLHKTDTVCNAICTAKKGTVYPKHAHDGTEYIIVIRGKLKLKMLGEMYYFYEGDFFAIPRNENHIVCFLDDTELHVIGKPAIQEFPGGGRFSYEREKYGIS